MTAYALAAMRSLHNYQLRVHGTLSYLADMSLAWLLRLVIFWVVSALILCIVFLLESTSLVDIRAVQFLFRCCSLLQFLLITVAICRGEFLNFVGLLEVKFH